MPAAARVGDQTTPPGIITGPGVSTVLIGNMPAAVVTDGETGNPPAQVPPGKFTKGSATVFIGGKPAIRAGDVSSAGLTPATGLSTVIIGG